MGKTSLIGFLKNPKLGLGRLNGWQRLWLISSIVVFVFHVLAVFALSPRIDDMFPNVEFKKSLLKDIATSIKNSEEKCRIAEAEEAKAIAANEEYNKIGREKVKKEISSVVASIGKAQERLMKLELTGKKYTEPWRATNDQLEVYHVKRLNLIWTDREFSPSMIENDEIYALLEFCKKQRERLVTSNAELQKEMESAEEERNRFIGNMISIVISFVSITMVIYFFGWSIGWIRKGFSK